MEDWGMSAAERVMAALEGIRRPAWVSEAVHRFALQVTRELEPDSLANGKRSLEALQGIGVWGSKNQYPLDVDVLVQPHLLERYARHLTREAKAGRGSQRTADNEVSRLRSIAARRTEAKYRPHVRSQSTKHLPQTPYSAGELRDRLRGGLLLERTEARRTYLSILALGTGAGLMPSEIHDARIEDLVWDGGTLRITRRSQMRQVEQVPISKKWAKILSEALALETNRDDGRILAAGVQRSGLDDFLRTLAAKSPPLTVKMSRLRATWILHRIEAGARVDEVMLFAGLKTAESLRFIVPLVKGRNEAAIRRAFG